MKIKNLLFDLGGVIVDINRMNCVEAYKKLGFADVEDFLGDYGQKGAFAMLESGKISAEEFREVIRQHIPGEVSDTQIDDAFEHFLSGIPVHRLDSLRKLRKKYKVYVLSNTNTIVWDGIIARSFAQQGGTINDYFDGIVTSFEAKTLKPSAEIFEYCKNKLGINVGETLFLDDSELNCEASRKCGFFAAHVKPGVEFEDILNELGLI